MINKKNKVKICEIFLMIVSLSNANVRYSTVQRIAVQDGRGKSGTGAKYECNKLSRMSVKQEEREGVVERDNR